MALKKEQLDEVKSDIPEKKVQPMENPEKLQLVTNEQLINAKLDNISILLQDLITALKPAEEVKDAGAK